MYTRSVCIQSQCTYVYMYPWAHIHIFLCAIFVFFYYCTKNIRVVYIHTPTGPRDQRGAPLSVYIHSYVHVCFIHTCIFSPFGNVRSACLYTCIHSCVLTYFCIFLRVCINTPALEDQQKKEYICLWNIRMFMKHTCVCETHMVLRTSRFVCIF